MITTTIYRGRRPRIVSMRKTKGTIMLALALGLVMAAIPRDVAASSSSTIYSFGTTMPVDGADPKGSLTYVNGLLFGRTTEITPGSGYGVIFHFSPNNVTSSYSIDHVFAGQPDGDNPRHDAMTPFNGLLYGTTLVRGTNNTGIIFCIGQDGTGYKKLISLAKDIGDQSHSCFVIVNNILYGMTATGGDGDEGVVFSFDPGTSNFQTLSSFKCTSLGAEPHGRLTLDPNGTTLYGMTRKGGGHGFGVVFSIDPVGGNYTVLHDFAGGDSDGATSDHGYVVQVGNLLYGMTTNGGPGNNGVIFSLTTDGGEFHLLHTFGATHHDGKNPYGSLLRVGDMLYGTTANGGDNDMGTVFAIRIDGGSYERLYSFGGKSSNDDGAKPINNVTLVNGALYGMTTEGGAHDQGAIFKVTPTLRSSPTPMPRPTPPPR
jgi:uncharacterized repeat protein (TIGR03803 family)